MNMKNLRNSHLGKLSELQDRELRNASVGQQLVSSRSYAPKVQTTRNKNLQLNVDRGSHSVIDRYGKANKPSTPINGVIKNQYAEYSPFTSEERIQQALLEVRETYNALETASP